MKLYHGTSEKNALSCLENGIKTRRELRLKHGNWRNTVVSNNNAVYLTSCYAPYFSFVASKSSLNENCAVIEIDTDLLNEKSLVPDEDALEQTSRGKDGIKDLWDMKERTRYYRKQIHKYKNGEYIRSLQALGTCAHIGSIPSKAITRIALFNKQDNREWVWACSDPSITTVNYHFMCDKYKFLNALLFHEREVALETFPEPEYEKQMKEKFNEYYQSIWDIPFDHSKVKIILKNR